MDNHIIIRADANTQMGTGHLMRCLALAQSWNDSGGKVTFITNCQNKGLLDRITEESGEIYQLEYSYPNDKDWGVTKEIIDSYPNAWVVFDGYHFDGIYQKLIKESGHHLLVIDDMAHLPYYYADIVLNQNIHAKELNYSCEEYTKLLLGTNYALLRREFVKQKNRQREQTDVPKKILISLGGADPNNNTLKVIQALQEMNTHSLEIIVVIGASNPNFETLQKEVKKHNSSIQIMRDVKDMPEFMNWADIAISAGGTTIWELAYMGLPTILLIQADNQEQGAQELNRLGAVANLGWIDNINMVQLTKSINNFLEDTETLYDMSIKLKTMVDGEGASRLVMHLRKQNLRLRSVRSSDCMLLWEWANDLDVRRSSFSPEPITWEQHQEWFIRKLENPQCHHFIAVDTMDAPIGQIRFDIRNEDATVDISIIKDKRNQGYGTAMLKLSTDILFRTTTVERIHSYIKVENESSAHIFEKAEFVALGQERRKGYQTLHLIKVKR